MLLTTNHHWSESELAAFAQQRRHMVEFQLRDEGIHDQRVLQAMATVPREEFVPPTQCDSAYGDYPVPIGWGQTISQPYTIAYMCQALQLTGKERVLEIGTGTGYAAAVLSLLATEVFTVERIAILGEEATARLQRLGFDNVQVMIGDGTLGLPAHAPFDAIVVTAGAAEIPPPYIRQLPEGGRLVIPLGGEPFDQCLYRLTKRGESLHTQNLGSFAFVPLIGRYGWRE